VSAVRKRRAPVEGGEVAFVDEGDPEAPAVVLLSGALTSSHVWRALIPMLAPWMRVVAPDLLGSGDADAPEGADLGLAAQARRVRELLTSLRIERFALGGHGHGGGVAQLVALGGGAEALLLVDSIASGVWPAPEERSLREDLASGRDVDAEAWVRAMVRRGVERPERLAGVDVDEYVRPFRGPKGRRRLELVASSLDGAGLEDVEDRLAGLDVPALVLWGEQDATVGAEVAERLGEALPRAAVALLPGCGHLLLEDAADTVAPLVFQWLRRQYLKMEHVHESGPVTVYLGRRPPGEGG
jgi:pimeloyl-ACP methyl ester carboxylesterase